MNSFLIIVYAVFLFGGALGGITFPIAYSIATKMQWRHNQMGVNVFLFSSIFALLYVRGAIQFFNPISQRSLAEQSFWSAIFIIIVTMLGAFVVWQRLWLLYDTVREDRKESRDESGS
jgi:hypothetical protein